jgi:hypothetical protein
MENQKHYHSAYILGLLRVLVYHQENPENYSTVLNKKVASFKLCLCFMLGNDLLQSKNFNGYQSKNKQESK